MNDQRANELITVLENIARFLDRIDRTLDSIKGDISSLENVARSLDSLDSRLCSIQNDISSINEGISPP